MGRGGHNAKTVEELKKNGTYQPKYHAGRKTYEFLKEAPEAPKYLNERQAEYWDHFCVKLVNVGLLTVQHLDSVEHLCCLRVDLDTLNAQVENEGATYTTDTGQIKANPAYQLKIQVQAQVVRLYEQFGFTPRTSMTMKAPAGQVDKDPFDEVLQMMKASTPVNPEKRPKA